MIFLHPDQRFVVDRHYEGPARIRGSAGTGKTVVALHRAAALVRRFESEGDGNERVLFTTFIKSLPPVFEELYGRLPSARPDDAIDFCHIDKLAHRICSEAGDRPIVDPRKVDATFAAAVRAILPEPPVSREYLREEITQVIKGRGITNVDAYLALERTGRRTPFGEVVRRQVWAVKERWDADLRAVDVVDFPDIVLRARGHARRRRNPTYRAAIIDEAQDLTLVGLGLVRSLVNGPGGVDRSDGLLVVGDGAQRIYAGGFTLRQAGVEVRGRTTVLRTNYRNSSQIIGTAMAVAGREEVDDLGETFARGDAPALVERSGERPVLVLCKAPGAGAGEEADWIAREITRLSGAGDLDLGDVVVATSTNVRAEEIERRLQAAGVATINLRRYTGKPVDKVKVGTYFRVKGLEFKAVFLAAWGWPTFPGGPHRARAQKRSPSSACWRSANCS
ncbi:MAG: UvrD-helicase domain-containing protein [Acidimicrobiales bacterium]